jgi:DNA polymerase III epsilon subunit-like protein
MFMSTFHDGEKTMLKGIHKLLNQADVVVHYNGKKFDVPTLNKEFLLNKMPPPAPYRQVDMLQVSRGNFRFQSQKLDYVAQQLGLGKKTAHEGFQLWVKCMENDPKAWARMKQYNMNDTVLLEKVYLEMLPWIKNHPNANLYNDRPGCPRCGSKHTQARGLARTIGGVYQRYQCKDCGGWSKGTKAIPGKPKQTGINA